MAMASRKIFVINLDSSKERWQASKNQITDVELERISAIDGTELEGQGEGSNYCHALNSQQYHKKLTAGEVGCYLSHRKVWQKIVDEQLDFAIVLEDDFICCADIHALYTDLSAITRPWHYIKLAEDPIKRKALLSKKMMSFNLVSYNKVPAKTCAQAISYQGAKRLLAMSNAFGRPVDVDIQYWWEPEIEVFGIRPYPFKIKQNIKSDIERKGHRKAQQSRFIKKAVNQLSFLLKNKWKTFKLVMERRRTIHEG